MAHEKKKSSIYDSLMKDQLLEVVFKLNSTVRIDEIQCI